VVTESETSVLRHATDAAIGRGTAPTTALPTQQAPSTTRELTKPKRRWILIAGVLLFAAVLTFAGYFYFTRKLREAEMRNVRARSGKIPANAIGALLHRTILVLFKRSVSMPITSKRFSL
jgi:hypothetical protein